MGNANPAKAKGRQVSGQNEQRNAAHVQHTIAWEGSGIMLDCKGEFAAVLLGVISFVAKPAAVQDVARCL